MKPSISIIVSILINTVFKLNCPVILLGNTVIPNLILTSFNTVVELTPVKLILASATVDISPRELVVANPVTEVVVSIETDISPRELVVANPSNRGSSVYRNRYITKRASCG
jgi:hypothetical protein